MRVVCDEACLLVSLSPCHIIYLNESLSFEIEIKMIRHAYKVKGCVKRGVGLVLDRGS